ncbi:testis-expressed protein 47-like isoform X2 [Mercenaria mercenaria]|uniref:testis-expressed protein 47-like isoform X2 n=1 Tax=Mercenaria mercenaria TaxID=6596 RepID=UPI00234E8CB0|nr:testis-expressed protein 47-like isoform X2 [Mercenaria mercenaria]
MAEKLSQPEIEKANKEEEKNDTTDQERQRPKSRSPDRRRKAKKPQERTWDWPKKSFFELSCFDSAEGGSSRMKNLVHRIVYIGKLKENVEDRMEVGMHHDRLIKNLQNNYQHAEPITGLLLVYLKHLVHVVETSSDMIVEVIRDVVKTQKDENGFIEQAKILIVSHDISTRLYQQWNFRTLDIQAARMESYESSEGADKIIIDLLSQLLKLGSKLAIIPKIAFKSTLDSLHEKFPDLLPQQAHIHFLLEENDSTMILPEEYLEMYEKPFDVTLESEMVWPLPTKLFPYN